MIVKNANVFVTGAASGIGRETMFEFLRRGAQVAAVDLDLAALEAIKAELGDYGAALQVHRLDVTDRQAFQALADQLVSSGFLPHVVVNNAGIGFLGPLFETPPEVWDKVWRVNVMGVVNGCQVFGPKMAEAGDARWLVNVASAASAGPLPNMSAYAATKWAVEGLNMVLAMELETSRLGVVSVHPGIINTAIVRDARAVSPSISPKQLDRLQAYYVKQGCHPEVVGQAVVEAVTLGREKLFVGPKAGVSALARRFLPYRLARRLIVASAREIGFIN